MIRLFEGVLPLGDRILTSEIFLLSGFSKLADPTSTIGYIEMVGVPFAPLAYGTAVIVEVVGGTALIVGYQTRLVAFGLALFSVATALSFHTNLADLNRFVHFFKNNAMVIRFSAR